MIPINENSIMDIVAVKDAEKVLKEVRRRYLSSFGMPAFHGSYVYIEYDSDYSDWKGSTYYARPVRIMLEIGFDDDSNRLSPVPHFYYRAVISFGVWNDSFGLELLKRLKPIGGARAGTDVLIVTTKIASVAHFNQVINIFRETITTSKNTRHKKSRERGTRL